MSELEYEAEEEYFVARWILAVFVVLLMLGFLAIEHVKVPDECKNIGAAAFVQGGAGLSNCKNTK